MTMKNDISYSDLRQHGFDTRVLRNGNIIFFDKKGKKKSSLSPFAPSTRLCAQINKWSLISDDLLSCIKSISYYSRELSDLFFIMYYSGCRVNEVLSLKVEDIISENSLLLKGSKGSDSRICFCPGVQLSFYKKSKAPGSFLFDWNRFQVLRFSKYYGINKVGERIFEQMPTKIFRYVYASLLYSQFNDYQLVGKTLGHVNVENAKYYIYDLHNEMTSNNKKRK